MNSDSDFEFSVKFEKRNFFWSETFELIRISLSKNIPILVVFTENHS